MLLIGDEKRAVTLPAMSCLTVAGGYGGWPPPAYDGASACVTVGISLTERLHR